MTAEIRKNKYFTGPWLDTEEVLALLRAERQKQRERWGDYNDDLHDAGELKDAATCYAYGARLPGIWPWNIEDWRDEDTEKERLVKAAAILIAEIERLDRADQT